MLCFNHFFLITANNMMTQVAHSKRIIELLKQRNIMHNTLSTIWGNVYGFPEHYIYATSSYLMSMFSQAFFVIIEHCISSPGHGIEVVDGMNITRRMFILQ